MTAWRKMTMDGANATGEPRWAEKLTSDLAKQSWAVVPGFLPPELALRLGQEIEELRSADALRHARVGRGAELEIRPDVRGDFIRWLEPTELTPAEQAAWDLLDELRVVLNRTFFLGLRDLEAHVTVYPAGTFYQKHVDQFRGTGFRIVSVIIYLNPDWQPADGGLLRLFAKDDHDAAVADVAPELGTLACFFSADIPHEVLPTTRARRSLTGWFRDQPL